MRKWTTEEEKLLLELYNKENNEELIRRFNRSYNSIYKKARELGMFKDKNIEFINRSMSRSGENGANWKGGKKTTRGGYVQILRKDHKRSDAGGYVMEHILVMEKSIGRELKENEVVHHINRDKKDNGIENLKLMKRSDHTKHHHIGSRRTQETREKISRKSKDRFKNKSNHPLYKSIEKNELMDALRVYTLTTAAKKLGVCRKTVYNKIEEFNLESWYKNEQG